MNWNNVKLILTREVRDQLRDRRTLFMIAVLPMLLYPLLGMSFFQVAQFLREQPTRVLVIDLPAAAGLPPLVENHHFAAGLFADKPERAKLLRVDVCNALRVDRDRQVTRPISPPRTSASRRPIPPTDRRLPDHRRQPADGRRTVRHDAGRHSLRARRAAVRRRARLPARLCRALDRLSLGPRHRLRPSRRPPSRQSGEPAADWPAAPTDGRRRFPAPALYHNSARETSQIALLRIDDVLAEWRQEIGEENLRQSHLPTTAAKPFRVVDEDVAEGGHREVALWSKILPFVLLLWALTGAFYPAVDLCAGEKERGTLETLLSSPAERSEIVWGKLLTVMLFSIATAVLESVEHGPDRQLRRPPHARLWSAAAVGHRLAADCPGAGVGPVQRIVPGAGGAGPQQQGGTVLSDAAGAGDHAADDFADVARRRIELGQQPDSGDRHRAAAAHAAGRQLCAGRACMLRRWWPSRSPAACWPCAGPPISSIPRACCSAKASGSTWACGCATCCAIATTRPAWPKHWPAAC